MISMPTSNGPSRFEILAGHIEDQNERWGFEGVISGPEPLYYILGILHEASQGDEIDGRELVDELFEQMYLNFGPTGFSFEDFYRRMERERASERPADEDADLTEDSSQV